MKQVMKDHTKLKNKNNIKQNIKTKNIETVMQKDKIKK